MLKISDVEPSTALDGLFTDGNVAGGISPTRLVAAWFNVIQTELVNVVESSGMDLDPDDSTQVLQALTKMFLSRSNPFADIAADGSEAITQALSNLGIDTALAEKSDLATGVLSSSGYIKIPISVSGNSSTLILQWGTFTGKTSSSAGTDNVYENSSIYVTWPITFPTGVLQVITGGSSDVPGAGVQEIAWNLAKTNTGATFGVSCREASASMSGSYIAIGY
ncbi:fucose-binding lectin II [Klebsiella pneumoniae]|uniref:fucose-binding lectin II n=1 Tax=Klebsiella TaxID=570 RepID=UPI002073F3DC|nr:MULTISPECIES: fucose-binding lectin II [Klebsiella]MCM5941055.1 fucose-binding lectin II [Klebsiella pneumoniae]MCM6305544.1 fucose-binding lectin II [Klebsiella pneumoniae]MDX6071463.1 fucose-binding lectin II [Klebsiella sp. CN_Kp107]WLY60968.1 fucose-binding lectin II [Klebsiella pneumoniae]HBV5136315.1 hypothetical protein [Klebsiella pneumoniae]